MQQPARYLIRTQTSTYVLDAGQMRAWRRPGNPTNLADSGALRPVGRRLLTDVDPLVLLELPQVELGHPMRLRVAVDEAFLDRRDDG